MTPGQAAFVSVFSTIGVMVVAWVIYHIGHDHGVDAEKSRRGAINMALEAAEKAKAARRAE